MVLTFLFLCLTHAFLLKIGHSKQIVGILISLQFIIIIILFGDFWELIVPSLFSVFYVALVSVS